MAAKQLSAEHGIVCHLPGEQFGYFGWPTVERLDGGTLIVASSGLRSEHSCAWGKTVINTSTDDGRTWSAPRGIHDSPLDDRDAGVLDLGGPCLLASWASAWPSATTTVRTGTTTGSFAMTDRIGIWAIPRRSRCPTAGFSPSATRRYPAMRGARRCGRAGGFRQAREHHRRCPGMACPATVEQDEPSADPRLRGSDTRVLSGASGHASSPW